MRVCVFPTLSDKPIFSHSKCSLNYTEEGLKAVLRLGNGDMRRVLNILQASSMAYDKIEEDHVYACTGNPLPSEIQSAVQSLLNDPFSKCYKSKVYLGTAMAQQTQHLCFVYSFSVQLYGNFRH